MKIPPQREHSRRVEAVTPKNFQALQRQIQELEEQMCKRINLAIRDEDSMKEKKEKKMPRKRKF